MSELSDMVAPALCAAGSPPGFTIVPLPPGFVRKGKMSMQAGGKHGDIQPGH